MKKYQSAISYWLLGVILIILIVPSIFLPRNMVGTIICIIVSAFVIHLFFSTYYIINDKELSIKSSFLVNKKVDINSIRKISETNNPISSPATSFDRLELVYNKHGSILISPKDKSGFIKDILKVNPEIEIVYK